MKLRISVKRSMVLYNKYNMEPLTIDKTVTGEWDENSTEYKILCEKYQDDIGYERGNTTKEKDRYDEQVLKLTIEDLKTEMVDALENIRNIIITCYTKNVPAYIEYAGHIINPADFCAVKILEPVVEYKKG